MKMKILIKTLPFCFALAFSACAVKDTTIYSVKPNLAHSKVIAVESK